MFCSLNAIESEEHMLLNFTLYNSLRNHFFDKMNSFDIKANLNNYHELLSTNNDKVINYLAVFISKCFKLRDNTLEVLRNKQIYVTLIYQLTLLLLAIIWFTVL